MRRRKSVPWRSDIEAIVAESMAHVEIPELPWNRVEARLRHERTSRGMRWWAGSVAVAVLLALAAVLHGYAHAGRTPTHNVAASRREGGAHALGCPVVIGILGSTQPGPEGVVTVHDPVLQGGHFITRYTGSSVPVGCGNKVIITETPIDPARVAFAFWRISGDAGRYKNTIVHGERLTFVASGKTEVDAVYVRVSKAPLSGAAQ